MTPTRGHDSHGESAGAYLLGALPELEAAAFERHVMGCADCRDEIERLRPAAEALPISVDPFRPSARLKEGLMAAVSEELPRPVAARPGIARRAVASARWSGGGLQGFWRRPAFALASLALLAGGMAGGYGLASTGDDPEMRTFALKIDRSHLADASGSVEITGEQAVLRMHGLPELPSRKSNRIYQMWLKRASGDIVPGPLLSARADGGGATAVTGDLEDVTEVFVTRERAGGARAPTEKPRASAKLS